MDITRRLFLRDGALSIATVGLAPSLAPLFMSRAARAAQAPRTEADRKVIVCIFQRGAVDGLSMVAPHGDPDYYKMRALGGGGIALAQTGAEGVIDLDGRFGLHPSLAPLKPLYDAGHLAPIHACGSPNPTRSHFDAQDFMESGAPGDPNVNSGWLTRTLRACPQDRENAHSALRAVAMTGSMPRSFLGDQDAIAISDLRTYGLANTRSAPQRNPRDPSMAQADRSGAPDFAAMYQQGADAVHGAGREAFEALRTVERLNAAGYTPENGAKYPAGGLGNSLSQIAQLIKAGVGLQAAFAECGGWDTHVRQGGAVGPLSARLRELGQALAAFYIDMGDRMGNVVVLTMSEFGRTARQNGNAGTDHGHGTCFVAMGGAVKGGRVAGTWPGLAPENLYQNRDLAVTTDFRDVFGELAVRHLGVKDAAPLFPGYASAASRFPGILKV